MFKTLFFIVLIGFSSCSQKPRDIYNFERDIKVQCFYGTTSPVPGLNPAIWRKDEHNNLIMNGLNGNYCSGCLSYNFDHRNPISAMTKDENARNHIAPLVKSLQNCQVMSTRTNSLKASSNESDIQNVVDSFGCDEKTMSIFTQNDYEKARALEGVLVDSQKLAVMQADYENYMISKYGRMIPEPTPDFVALREASKDLKKLIIQEVEISKKRQNDKFLIIK